MAEDGISYFERVSNQTIWIVAPDEQTLEALQKAIHLPLRTSS
jgi:2'-5' RNA ligase